MSSFIPKGRGSLPKELLRFGKHLVYMEGTKTEPYYIDDIKANIAKKYDCEPNDIQIIKASRGKRSLHTVELVKYAEKDVKKRLKDSQQNNIDHVWIFFDKDSFDNFEEAHNLILNKNTKEKINSEGLPSENNTGIVWHSCWSNECFELWLWLYYDYCESQIQRKDYKKKLEDQSALKKIGFKYEKNLEGIHTLLQHNNGNVKNAIKNAKKLNKINGINCPSTGVYCFMEYFLPYMNL